MEREEIFIKLKRKDYNDKLEQVLENKPFSEDTKNLLLSMFYKIENAYADYQKVKQEVPTKGEFLENLIQIIMQDCEEIILVKPQSTESRELEEHNLSYLLDRDKKKITVYPNEKNIMNAILQLGKNRTCFSSKNTILSDAICEFTRIGNCMHKAEVLRDFNGWSWNISKLEIDNIQYNMIYQNIIYLLGEICVSQWIQNIFSEIEPIIALERELTKQYQKDAEVFLNLFYQAVLSLYVIQHPKEKEELFEQLEIKKRQFELLENKKQLLEEITKSKREINQKIGEIDKILNDHELIKSEYKKRNAKLPNKEKIFSISHLADKLEQERKQYLYAIEEYNSILEPKEYVARKNKIKEEIQFIESLPLQNNEKLTDSLIKLQLAFLKCITRKIENCQNKKNVIYLIYLFRYYYKIPFDLEKNISQIPEIKDYLTVLQKKLLNKAKELKVYVDLEVEEQLGEEIFKKLLNAQVINLENIEIKIKTKEDNTLIECYDDNILEEEWNSEIKIKHDKQKRNKRIHLLLV